MSQIGRGEVRANFYVPLLLGSQQRKGRSMKGSGPGTKLQEQLSKEILVLLSEGVLKCLLAGEEG